MEYCLYFSDLSLLAQLDSLFDTLDAEALPTPLKATVLENPNAAEYTGHLAAVERLQSLGVDFEAFSRFYFGQEFCEHRVPTPEELTQAYAFARQFGWNFSFVTGYAPMPAFERIHRDLDALARLAAEAEAPQPIEVIVNDWGVLRLLRRKFPQFRPVLGRLLTKQKRLGRFPDRIPPPYMEEIDTAPDTILRNQGRAWRNLNFSIREWREFLKTQGIERIDIDMVPQGAALLPEQWGLRFGTYYPWAYLTAARNCPTAGLFEPERTFVPMDRPCPQPCRSVNVNLFNLARDPAAIVQRGVVVVTFNDAFAKPYLSGDIPVDRIVFEPFIPL